MKKDLSITPKGIEILKEKETHLDTKKISDKWMSKYVLAKKYYEHYGNLEIPTKFKTKNGIDYDEKGIQLGRWIHNKRQGIKGLNTCKINSEQIKLLEEIGIRLDNIDRMQEWKNKYNLAKAYYEYYGNLEIPYRFKTKNGVDYDEDGIKLGIWINLQRQSFQGKGTGIITLEQIKLLEEIEIRWDSIFRDERWMNKYKLAKSYYEYYGNLNVNRNFKTKNGIDYNEDGIQLGRWVYVQRLGINGDNSVIMTPERIRLLEEIGIRMNSIISEEQWMSKFALAKKYYEYYGNLEIPATFKTKNGVDYDGDGVNLGNWLFSQRKAYNGKDESKITSEQIKLLNEIEIRWDNIDRMPEWINKYNLAKAYYEHYRDLEIPHRFKTKNGVNYDEDGINLGKWIAEQRQSFKGKSHGKITLEQIKLLEEIGMKWFADNIDNKLQSEIINKGNIKRKQIEMRNRFYSVLNSFEDEELPTKEELNNKLLCKLNHKK